ncbi:DUF4303 domain-containing protein [Paenibacillus sp. NPDC057934]|uniref:DUF4303 domain-containing protein n=1 Tax=Paenibacillus sp. NPDC057934 TaxID=3346282 RepID=UPI0036D988C1
MADPDFSLFKEVFIEHCSRTLEDFSKTEGNQDVYAVVLDAEPTYGRVLLRWNTLAALQKTIESYYDSYTPNQVNGRNGLKFNAGDFSYEDPAQPEVMDEFAYLLEYRLSELYDKEEVDDDAPEIQEANDLRAKFIEMLIEVVDELQDVMQLLNKTDDFMAFVVDHDEDYFQYLDRTVSQETYYRAFPEMKRFAEHKERIKQLPITQQIEYWFNNYLDLDFILGKDTDEASKLKGMYLNQYDMEDELKLLGAPATDWLVTRFEMLSGYRPMSDGITVVAHFSIRYRLMNMLTKIGLAEEETTRRLLQILFRKYEEESGEFHESIHIARTLHALNLVRYPEAEIDESRTILTNIESYQKLA